MFRFLVDQLCNDRGVSGSPLNVLGKVWLNFVIKADVFPFEAYVIKDLTHDVVLGRDFLQKYCSRIDFMENIIEVSHPEDLLPLADSFGDDLDGEVLIMVFCQCLLIILLLFPLNQKSLSLGD